MASFALAFGARVEDTGSKKRVSKKTWACGFESLTYNDLWPLFSTPTNDQKLDNVATWLVVSGAVRRGIKCQNKKGIFVSTSKRHCERQRALWSSLSLFTY